MTAAVDFARALRAGDGLSQLAGAQAVLDRLGAEVTVVWGCARPGPDRPVVKWVKDNGAAFTEDEARVEARRHHSWWLVRCESVSIDFTTRWAPVPDLPESPT